MSDISSLDGDDFEVIDAPHPERHDDDLLVMGESFDDLGVRSQASSFLSVGLGNSRRAESIDSTDHDAVTNRPTLEESEVLPSRNSLSTLRHSDLLDHSSTSSHLRFPDPLGDSFQERVDESNQTVAMQPLGSSLGTPRLDGSEGSSESHADGTPGDPSKQDFEGAMQKQQHVEPLAVDGKAHPEVSTAISTRPDPPKILFEKGFIASKAFKTVVGLFLIIFMSETLSVWRSLPSPSSTFSNALTAVAPASTAPFAQTERSLSTVPNEATKSMISIGEAAGMSTSASATVKRRNKCHTASPRSASKELSIIVNHSSDLVIYAAETYSSFGKHTEPRQRILVRIDPDRSDLAVDWLSTKHSMIPTLDLSIPSEGSLSLGNGQIPRRLLRPSRKARKLTRSLQRQWISWVRDINRFVQPVALSLINEANYFTQDVAQTWRTARPAADEVLVSLQKKWAVWMRDVMHMYLALSSMFAQEVDKFRGDFQQAFRTARKRLRRTAKGPYSLTPCQEGALHSDATRARQQASLYRRQMELMNIIADQARVRSTHGKIAGRAKKTFYSLAIHSGQARLRLLDAWTKTICQQANSPSFSSAQRSRRANHRKSQARRLHGAPMKAVNRARKRAAKAFSRRR